MKSGELAKLLGVSDATIRDWTGLYGEFLSPRGKGAQPGATREFSEADALALASVAHLRNEGLAHDEIVVTLRDGWRLPELPEKPSPEVEAARREVVLVPIAEAEKWRALAVASAEERDKALERERGALARIAELSEEIGRLKGEAKLIPRLERQISELKAEVAALKEQLEESRRRRGLFGR